MSVSATYTRLDGRAAKGQVFFSSVQVLVDSSSGEIVPPVDFVATLDANGAISIDLPATDDDSYEPQGWTYTVTEDTDGGDRPPFGLSVPADGGAIDLADVAPPGPTESLTADEYTLLSTFTAHRSAWGGDPPTGVDNDLLGLDANNLPKIVNVTNMSKLRTKHSPRVDITHRDFGAATSATAATNTTAIQSALDFADANGGGTVYCPITGNDQYSVDGTLIIPKNPRVGVMGPGGNQARILASGLASTAPVFKWDDSVAGSVRNSQFIVGLLIDRDNEGRVIEFLQNSGSTGASGDRFFGKLFDLEMRNTAGLTASGDLVYMEYAQSMRGEDLRFDGNARAMVLENSSHARLRNLIVPTKVAGPRILTLIGGGNHVVWGARTEGGDGGPSYHLNGSVQCRLYGIGAEGHAEDNVVLLEAADGTLLSAPVIGVADDSAAASPRGIKFLNSSGCRIVGGKIGNYENTFPGAGDALEFDANSNYNSVTGLGIDGGSPSANIVDNGSRNEIVVHAVGSSPKYSRTALTPLFGRGVLSNGGVAKVGTLDGFGVQLVQNDVVKVAISSSAVEIQDHATTANLEPATDDVRLLGSTSKRYQTLALSNYVERSNQTTPATPPTGRAYTYLFDNSGSQELRIIFANGVVKTIATDV